MLSAININSNERFNVVDGLPKNPKEIKWKCHLCQEPLIYVKESYKGRIQHFRHQSEALHETEPETIEHLKMKARIYKALKQNPFYYKVKLEYKIGNQIADVYAIDLNEKEIAIECQCCKISNQELLTRTKKYSDKNIYCLWVLGKENFLNGFQMQSDLIRISILEKSLKKIYNLIYYFSDELNCIDLINLRWFRRKTIFIKQETTTINLANSKILTTNSYIQEFGLIKIAWFGDLFDEGLNE